MLLSFLVIHLTKTYYREVSKRKGLNKLRVLESEIKKTDQLLRHLVPSYVLAGIKSDQKVVDDLEEVTLLFTDMVNFTKFSNSVQPKDVVQLLSDLFNQFDSLLMKYDVYKVHTIGDCYVVSGYTGAKSGAERTKQDIAQEAFNVLSIGFEMIDIIRKVRDQATNEQLKALDMRIGIHTGDIIAGIIGTKIVRYDIFGQNVLIANKMESNGVPGKINVSETTKTFLTMFPELELDKGLEFKFNESVNCEAVEKVVDSFIVDRTSEESIGDRSRMIEGDSGSSSSGSEID